MSARTIVVDALTTLVAAVPALSSVQVVPAARDIGDLDRPYLVVKTSQYEPTPQAPTRNTTWTGTVTLVSPHRDQERAEQQLEDLLEVLGPLLINHQFIWQNAQLTNFDDQHLSLDITVSSIFQKE